MANTEERSTRPSSGSRVPPHDLQAEESLLGAMLLSRDAIATAVEVVAAGDFYKPAHGHVFEAIASLYGAGEPVDPVTVADELRRAGLLDAIGGPAVLASIQGSTPATTSAGRYARIVEELALLRRLIGVAGEIAEMGYDLPEDVTKTVDRAESLVFEVAQRRVTDTLRPVRDLLSDNLDRLEQLYERGDAITGIPTGYLDLDDLLSGLQPSALVVVGARPAMGKCVAWDTPVVDPRTGALRTAAEVHRAGRSGGDVRVLALGDDHRVVEARPSAFVDDGAKPVFRVRTRLGREVRTTLTHPFLTRRGWLPLGQLHPGEEVAVPRVLPVFGKEPLPVREVALLAYLVGAGEGTEVPPFVRCADTVVAGDLAEQAAAFDARVVGQTGPGGLVTFGLTASPAVAELARRHRLEGPPSGWRLPEAVFRLPRGQLALFLNRLFAIGASSWTPAGGAGGGRVIFATASSRVARDVQHLLLRFGVSGLLRSTVVASDEERTRLHEVEITGAHHLARLAEEIGVFGQEATLAALAARATVQARSGQLVGAPSSGGPSTLMDGLDDPPTDVWWDEIVAIEADGVDQVYDLTVPELHNFVAGDVFVHNTAFALGMGAHAALDANRPVLLFSLEMSHLELTQRLLCAEARVDSRRMRNGNLTQEDWEKISHAVGRLAEAPIWIDDNPNLTVMEIRAKARRLKSRVGDLGMVVVDYLQLMTGRSGAENRQVEVSEISRGLKILARELEAPVVALSQLSRSLEMRADKRPILADLRESGCLTADTKVLRCDTGAEVSLGELLEAGERDIPVWTLDDDLRMVPGRMTHVFPSGVKETFELWLASGRTVKASGNHPFLTVDGWRPLDELAVGVRVAIPRSVPEPKAAEEWPEAEVVMLARSKEKFVPPEVFSLTNDQVALFLRHLWATDGCVAMASGQPRIYYGTSSPQLARDVASLLLRFGIVSRTKTVGKAGYGPSYHVHVTGAEAQRRFIAEIGVHGARGAGAAEIAAHLARIRPNTNVDTVPAEIWGPVRDRLRATGTSARAFAAALGTAYCGSTLYRHAPSRDRLGRIAEILDDDRLRRLATSDVLWDKVVAIEPLGVQPVYDATVLGTHNFIADGIAVHNSIEQDADVVMFIYRDDVYNPESPDRGTAEILVSKHRNGPTGMTRLAFLDHYTRFANMARGV